MLPKNVPFLVKPCVYRRNVMTASQRQIQLSMSFVKMQTLLLSSHGSPKLVLCSALSESVLQRCGSPESAIIQDAA